VAIVTARCCSTLTVSLSMQCIDVCLPVLLPTVRLAHLPHVIGAIVTVSACGVIRASVVSVA
jgi:hypothetical protein